MNSEKYSNTRYDDNIGSSRSKSEGPHDSIYHQDLDVHIQIQSTTTSASSATYRYRHNNFIFTMPPPKSKCWTYFKKLDHLNAQCKICSQSIKYSGNTSNLAKHLKKHSNVLEPGTSGSTAKTTAKQLKLTSTASAIINPISTHRYVIL